MTEIGRSMTETLGVLAVVGLLSIGALVSYRHAMDKSRANDTINDLTARALLLGSQFGKSEQMDMGEFGTKTTTGYSVVAFEIPDYPNLFELEVSDVPTGVCEQILHADWRLPAQIKANDIPFNGHNFGICESDDGSSSIMLFEFDKDLQQGVLGSGRCEDINNCGACEVCEESICTSICSGTERCVQDTETGASICCPRENRAGPYCCASTVNGKCCNSSGQCCDWWKPLVDKNGTCYECDTEIGIDVTGVESNCNACNKREIWEYQKKSLCVLKCADGLRDNKGQCYGCLEPNPVHIDGAQKKPEQYCTDLCPNRIVSGARDRYCILGCEEEEFTSSYGTCSPCDKKENVNVGYVDADDCETACVETPRKKFIINTDNGENAVCVLPCEGTNQFRGDDGVCYDCNYPEAVYMLNAQAYCAAACPGVREPGGSYNRFCMFSCGEGTFTGTDGNCHSCNKPENVLIHHISTDDCETNCQSTSVRKKFGTGGETSICVLPCEGTNQFRGDDGVCYDCNYPEVVYMRGALSYCAEACPNDRIAAGNYNRYCVLKCEGDNFIGGDGGCYACDYDKNVQLKSTTHSGCDRCPLTRDLFNEQICAPKCNEDNPLRGSDNVCYPCDTELRIPVINMTDSCKTCFDKRKLDGEYCVLK